MRRHIHRFISLVIVGSFANLLISLLFSSSLNSNLVSAQQLRSNAPPPQSAYIEKVCHQVPDQSKCKELQTKYVNIVRGGNPQGPAKPGDNVRLDRRLQIEGQPAIGAMLGFKSKGTGEPIKGYLAAAGFSSRTTQYFYPCQIEGGKVLMGWTPESANRCKEIRYRSTTLIGPKVESKAKTSKQDHLYQSIISSTERPKEFLNLGNQKLEIAQSGGAPVYYRQYCSAVKDAGGEWKVELADFTYTNKDNRPNNDVPLTSAEDVCNKAVLACEGNEVGSCSVFSYGSWIANSPQPINLTLTCSNPAKVYYRRGREQRTATLEERLEEVKKLKNDLEEEARGERAESCVFDIYSDGDVSIKPSDQQRTWIYTNSTEKGFTIDVLAGEARIKPLREKSADVVTLKAGQRYEYLRPQARSLTRDEKKKISEEPIVQEFITCSNWQEWGVKEICDELKQYQQALNREFYQRPAVTVSKFKSKQGIDVWLSKIDLSQPGVIATLADRSTVAGKGGFDQFVKAENAALIASGTFKNEQKNDTWLNRNVWTMRSKGEFIEDGQYSKSFSRYTTLAIKRNNEIAMVPRSRAEWEQYWFAITGYPALVENNKVSISTIPGTKMDEEYKNQSRTGRAAIGFSGKTLFHAITEDGLSLQEVAQLMVEIGCEKAMNLEGGNGRFLADRGKVIVSGELRSPLIVIYDSANPPKDKTISDGWASFSSK